MADDLRSDEAKYMDAEIAKAVARERERCATIAESFIRDADGGGEVWIARRIADAIRRRR